MLHRKCNATIAEQKVQIVDALQALDEMRNENTQLRADLAESDARTERYTSLLRRISKSVDKSNAELVATIAEAEPSLVDQTDLPVGRIVLEFLQGGTFNSGRLTALATLAIDHITGVIADKLIVDHVNRASVVAPNGDAHHTVEITGRLLVGLDTYCRHLCKHLVTFAHPEHVYVIKQDSSKCTLTIAIRC